MTSYHAAPAPSRTAAKRRQTRGCWPCPVDRPADRPGGSRFEVLQSDLGICGGGHLPSPSQPALVLPWPEECPSDRQGSSCRSTPACLPPSRHPRSTEARSPNAPRWRTRSPTCDPCSERKPCDSSRTRSSLPAGRRWPRLKLKEGRRGTSPHLPGGVLLAARPPPADQRRSSKGERNRFGTSVGRKNAKLGLSTGPAPQTSDMQTSLLRSVHAPALAEVSGSCQSEAPASRPVQGNHRR
mmetsp:Transcript_29884/g.56027  ORF Transcript_29884/g.56027 Transcript_29884/m.56027 type:complete len:240 (-) Transcript_29884:257-976(-)